MYPSMVLAYLSVVCGSVLNRDSLSGFVVCWSLVRSIGVERTIFFWAGYVPCLCVDSTYLSWGVCPSFVIISCKWPLIVSVFSGAQTSHSFALVIWAVYYLNSSYIGSLHVAK